MAAVTRSLVLGCLAAALLAGMQGCAPASHREKSVAGAIRAAEAAPAPDSDLQPPREEGRQTVAVVGFPEVPPFETVARTPRMETYPCSQCHTASLSVLTAHRAEGERLSHWQVKMQHAPDSVMSCQTCHGTGNMDQLLMLSGEPVSFDAPYTLCAQCHMTQVKDWAGGAHGKRLDGWAGKRVVENCTGCHNPHSPAFETRWPAQLRQGVR